MFCNNFLIFELICILKYWNIGILEYWNTGILGPIKLLFLMTSIISSFNH